MTGGRRWAEGGGRLAKDEDESGNERREVDKEQKPREEGWEREGREREDRRRGERRETLLLEYLCALSATFVRAKRFASS
jgi:hypothetical protein